VGVLTDRDIVVQTLARYDAREFTPWASW